MRPDPLEIFEVQRSWLLRIGYRMLGSRTEAEDIVQEAWLRWQGGDHGTIVEPAAWLTHVVSRPCLDQRRSARARRESYPGTWLPEPLIEPPDESLRPDNLTLTLMMALERLSPLERATFLLHDVFGQSMNEIGTTINRSSAATRKLAARARAHVQIDRPRYPVPRDTAKTPVCPSMAGIFIVVSVLGLIARSASDDARCLSDHRSAACGCGPKTVCLTQGV